MKSNTRKPLRQRQAQQEKTQHPFFSIQHDSKNHTDTPFFQTQLKTGEKGDKYEKEADATADKVVNQVPAPAKPVVQKQDISTVQTSSMKDDEKKPAQKSAKEEEKPVQKKEDDKDKKVQKMNKEEEKPVQKAAKEEEKKTVQKKEDDKKETVQHKHEEEQRNEHPPVMHQKKDGAENGGKKSSLSERIEKSRGKGAPMSEKTAKQMEKAFGTDLSKVVIHTDEESAALNKDMHSKAFATGTDIYFGQGEYNPESSAGKTLLAHELTHVIQQTGNIK